VSGPEELRRIEQVGGHWVELADGHSWVVPAVRCFPSGTQLPVALALGPAGEEVVQVLPRHQELYAGAERFWQWRYAAGLAAAGESVEVVPMSGEELWGLAREALTVNYRVGLADLEALLTPENLVLVLDALVDGPAMRAVLASQGEDDG
jgi:hypothetical protein